MLYVLRLSSGDCIVAAAEDESSARGLAGVLGLQADETIATVRTLSGFAVRLSPTDSGALEVDSWDDATLDDFLVHEYPLLKEALHTANSVRFMSAHDPTKPVLEQLREAHAENVKIIREGLHRERARLNSTTVPEKRRAAGK